VSEVWWVKSANISSGVPGIRLKLLTLYTFIRSTVAYAACNCMAAGQYSRGQWSYNGKFLIVIYVATFCLSLSSPASHICNIPVRQLKPCDVKETTSCSVFLTQRKSTRTVTQSLSCLRKCVFSLLFSHTQLHVHWITKSDARVKVTCNCNISYYKIR